MKSTLFNMVAVLFTVTLIASAGVGAVNMITADAIAEANAAATTQAVANVLPSFENTEVSEQTIDDMPIVVYTATAQETVVGYAVESMTKNGFGGVIRMMVGFSPKGEILNVNILQQAETPGLGTKMADEDNALIRSIKDKKAWEIEFKVKKDGGELDALTAATISSRAYIRVYPRHDIPILAWRKDTLHGSPTYSISPNARISKGATYGDSLRATNNGEGISR